MAVSNMAPKRTSLMIDTVDVSGLSVSIDVWNPNIENAKRYGATCLGQPRYEKSITWFADSHETDFTRTEDQRIRVPWFQPDGTRSIIVHMWNISRNQAQIARLMGSVRRDRVCYQMRSPPFVCWSIPRKVPLLCFAWGHLLEAIYRCLEHDEYRHEDNIKFILAEGFLVPVIFSSFLPKPCLLWMKSWSNEFGKVSSENVFEWIVHLIDLSPKWEVYAQDVLGGGNNQQIAYRHSMLAWWTQNVSPDILKYLKKDVIIQGETPYSWDKLEKVVSLASAMSHWDCTDRLRTYYGWNVDDLAYDGNKVPEANALMAALVIFKRIALSLANAGGHALPKSFSGHSQSVTKVMKDLYTEALFFQLCRRCLPHRTGAPEFTPNILNSSNGFGDNIVTYLFQLPLSGTETSKVDDTAWSTDLSKASATSKQGQAEIRKLTVFREIRKSGFQKSAANLKLCEDMKQITFGTVASFVSKSKLRGEKLEKEISIARTLFYSLADKHFDYVLSTMLPPVDKKPQPLGVHITVSEISEHLKEWSKFRVHIWSTGKSEIEADVTKDSAATIATKLSNSISRAGGAQGGASGSDTGAGGAGLDLPPFDSDKNVYASFTEFKESLGLAQDGLHLYHYLFTWLASPAPCWPLDWLHGCRPNPSLLVLSQCYRLQEIGTLI